MCKVWNIIKNCVHFFLKFQFYVTKSIQNTNIKLSFMHLIVSKLEYILTLQVRCITILSCSNVALCRFSFLADKTKSERAAWLQLNYALHNVNIKLVLIKERKKNSSWFIIVKHFITMPPHGSLYINCSNNIRYHFFFSEITRPSKLTEFNANFNILWGYL